jgi:hypothetical protein
MLVDVMSGKRITRVPFDRDYRIFISRLDAGELAAVKAQLNSMIDGTEVQTAGWMPGSDWTGTPFQPVYEKAARYDPDAAARCFGLIVWEVFMERPETWGSGRFEKDGRDLGSRTYFRIDRDP